MLTITKDDSMQCGQRVLVYIDNRHDFQRYATVIRFERDTVVVRYDNGECETVPLRWIT